MSEKMKHAVVALLMGVATVVAILLGFLLCIVIFYGLDIAMKTHPAVTALCGFAGFSIVLAIAYYNKKFK